MSCFQFIIKDKKFAGYKKIASFLFIINAVIFFALALDSLSRPGKTILFATAFILFTYSFYHWLYKKKKERSYTLIYLLMAAIWIAYTPSWYFAILFVALLILQWRMENDLTISLSPAGIVIDGLTKRNYPWSAFNNIILKDGLLTLDFANNQVIQAEPDWAEPPAPGIVIHNRPGTHEWPATTEDYTGIEKEFNEFCRGQLKK